MTAYFDEFCTRVRGTEDVFMLNEMERQIVYDVTVCVMLPECPDDIRLMVHRAILRRCVFTGPDGSGVDFETIEQHRTALKMLASDLHDVMHELGNRGIPGFSDSPKAPLNWLAGAGEEAREQLFSAMSTEVR